MSCDEGDNEEHSAQIAQIRERDILSTVWLCPGETLPPFGRTQYRLGAVVLILKCTHSESGLASLSSTVTIWSPGSGGRKFVSR